MSERLVYATRGSSAAGVGGGKAATVVDGGTVVMLEGAIVGDEMVVAAPVVDVGFDRSPSAVDPHATAAHAHRATSTLLDGRRIMLVGRYCSPVSSARMR
jgi:hypothetical protein